MTSREDLDVDDDDFSEIYKAYSGPLGSNAAKVQNKTTTTNKRSQAGSDEEEEPRDPNAVPTDFTSREAKVWEAKSKATERNWKKRKEEEMICKICGESGHFTQGCPSTLGANRKSQDFFERVPARDPHVKALFSERVVNKIEKDIGCKIKIEEKFIIVSGKDRLVLKKGVDAVHKIKEGVDKGAHNRFPEEGKIKEGVNKGAHNRFPEDVKIKEGVDKGAHNRFPEEGKIKEGVNKGAHNRFPEEVKIKEGVNKGAHNRFPEEGDPKGSSSISPVLHSKSVERGSPLTSRLGRSDSQKFNPSPPHITHNRYGRQEKIVEDRVREDLKKLSSGSPRAYGSDGGRGQPMHSKSPTYMGNSYSNSYEGHTQDRGGWNAADRARSSTQLDLNFDYPSFPQTLEELGLQYKREALELARIRDKEEDEENLKHREALGAILGGYTKKVTSLSITHANLWEEFLQLEGQKRQQAHQRVSESGFGGYKQSSYAEFNSYHSGDGVHSRGRLPNAMDGYPSPRPQDPYDNYQRHRREDFGKPYHRY